MFKHILLPLAVSDSEQRVVDAAAELTRDHSAVLSLIHVVETLEDAASADGADELEGFYDELCRKAEAKLGAWAAPLADAGLQVDVSIVRGKRAREIVAAAESGGCDLIVMGTHRIDREHPAGGLGTVSHQVALLAPCAVLLLR
ncbi:MAG: universal stress protein [Myxococcales bacterium]|nr:universal stress protein [Myxococcales bacterium]